MLAGVWVGVADMNRLTSLNGRWKRVCLSQGRKEGLVAGTVGSSLGEWGLGGGCEAMGGSGCAMLTAGVVALVLAPRSTSPSIASAKYAAEWRAVLPACGEDT